MVRRIGAAIASMLLLASLVPLLTPGVAVAAGETPAQAAYTFDLTSSHRGRWWDGTGSVVFSNTGPQPLDVVWFRLWANGSTGCSPPALEVSGVTGGTLGDLAVGCTAMPVALEPPLAPGATAEVAFDLAFRVPEANDRFGWFRGTARMGNALPILAVHDDEEGWHLEPYFASGESFSSLVADWTVTLRVPPAVETPATGTLVDTATDGGRRETRTYLANDVRDFAWQAGELEVARARTDRTNLVRLWFPEWLLTRERAKRLVDRSAHIMDTFSDAFGAYPYHEVDVVITTFDSLGGMEYPQLVMSIPSPLVISHELAHQWWYGVVGNDQYEDPWIDEGFAQWSQYLPFERRPARWPPVPWVGCSMFEWPNDEIRLSSGIDYFAQHPFDYWVPYLQGGCALAHLAKDFGGLEPFLAVLRSYAADHWLGVATNDDVMTVISDAAAEAGIDLVPATFFDRWRISRP